MVTPMGYEQLDLQLCTISAKRNMIEPWTEYQNDFEGFCLNVLGVTLWDKQIEIGNSVRDNKRTAVSACYASGKTFTAACLVLWWLFTRRPAMVITTAPTGRQVRNLLWREIRKLHRKALRRLPGPKPLQVRLELSDDWLAFGFSSDDPASVAGLHEGSILFIEDEAAGITQTVADGFEGITIGDDARHLKIGNPIVRNGPFIDALMHPTISADWNKIFIDAEQTPNVLAGKVVVPHLVERSWVELKRKNWLERGLLELWITRVKGRPYTGTSQKVCPEDWIYSAIGRWNDASEAGECVLGCDIGAGGADPTVILLRKGQKIFFVEEWSTDDLIDTGNRIAQHALRLGAQRIVIDRTGPGQGAWNQVCHCQFEGIIPDSVHIQGVRSNVSPTDKDTFKDRASEICFWLRDAISPKEDRSGLGLQVAFDPDCKPLHEEAAYRNWSVEYGKVSCDNKRELKKHGKGSPDYADAAALCCAPTNAITITR